MKGGVPAAQEDSCGLGLQLWQPVLPRTQSKRKGGGRGAWRAARDQQYSDAKDGLKVF